MSEGVHVCGIITGEKLIISGLANGDPGIGWILPCETFKSRPVLFGHHCDNIADIKIEDALESEYMKTAKWFVNVWDKLRPPCQPACPGQWLIAMTDAKGNPLGDAHTCTMPPCNNCRTNNPELVEEMEAGEL